MVFDSDVKVGDGALFHIPIRATQPITIKPLVLSGTNVGSPNLEFHYFDSLSVSRSYTQHVHTNGDFVFDAVTGAANRYWFNIGARFTSQVDIPNLTTGLGPGTLVCVSTASGQLYKATGTTCP
jgi:hypothetical protein